ncbi:DUF6993 domain-containing protein [Leifsonia sp. NPDC058292]|uniref:DUF6993 domain-containing protein n=1 Tax=Leifsonia sp. NPDC058292 TaxID=3346428 RepID=UPI0036DC5065
MPQPSRQHSVPTSRAVLAQRASVAAASTLGAVCLALVLSGCVGAGGSGGATSSAATTPTATSATTPAAPVQFFPNGTAQQNLPFFDQVNRATLAAKPDAVGRDFIDALVAAGFTKADMQLTVDTTTIGLKANSIQFSVLMGSSCLIGQNGADAGGYNSQVVPQLADGGCLIGQTKPIDW